MKFKEMHNVSRLQWRRLAIQDGTTHIENTEGKALKALSPCILCTEPAPGAAAAPGRNSRRAVLIKVWQDGFSSREPNGAGSTCGHVGKSQAEKQEECEALAIGVALVLWHIATRDIASAWVICWAAAGTRNNLRLTHVKQATLVPVHALQTPSLVLAEGPKHFKSRPRTHAQKPWYSSDGN